MKIFLSVTLLLLFPIITYSNERLVGTIVWVSDGDTITLATKERKKYKIRFYGIDCPEISQAFGKEAKRVTYKLAMRKKVSVIVKAIDFYGRTVGIVYVNDSLCLNEELLRSGLAWWYKRYAKDNTLYERLQQEAKSKRLGLWSKEGAIAPWVYRRNKKGE